MKSNFYRILAITFRHRLTAAASIVCSLAIAFFWVTNLTPLYWVVDVVMLDKSIPQWLDEQQATRRQQGDDFAAQIAARSAQLADANDGQRSQLRYELANLQHQQARTARDLAWYESASSWVHRALPATAYRTLLLVCAWVAVGTVLKSLFRIAGTYFTSRLGHVVAFELRKEFYRRTLSLDLGTFRQTTQGDLMNRFTNNVSVAANGAMSVYGSVIREPLSAIGCLRRTSTPRARLG